MSDGSNYLDPNRPDAVRLSVSEARAVGEGALARIGYGDDDARIVTDQLIDNSLCGYRFAGLPRILATQRALTPLRLGLWGIEEDPGPLTFDGQPVLVQREYPPAEY